MEQYWYSSCSGICIWCSSAIFQYVTQNNQYKRQGFSQSIYTFFELGADREEGVQYPNFIQGYGLLNARKILKYLDRYKTYDENKNNSIIREKEMPILNSEIKSYNIIYTGRKEA